MWDDALNQKAAARNFQPAGGGQRAGVPGMGAGPVPYAPGATQYRPNTEPPRQNVAPAAPEQPQGAGNGAAMAPDTSQSTQPATGAPAAPQAPPDPMLAMRYAAYLMRRYMMGRQQGQYRG